MQYNSLETQLGMWDRLFEAIMRRDGERTRVLKTEGARLSDRLRYALSRGCYVSDSNKRVSEFAEAFTMDINSMSAEELLDIIPRLYAETGARLSYSYVMSQRLAALRGGSDCRTLRDIISEPAAFRCFLEYFDHRLKRWETVSYLIVKRRIDLLGMCAERNWFDDPDVRKLALSLSEERKDTEITSFLLGYISQRYDLAAEREREERRKTRELFAPEDSIIVMRKKWKWKKLPGGTVKITGYMGGGSEVAVPEWIGSRAVTAIGANAFSPPYRRISEIGKVRRVKITNITLPDTITLLEDDAFAGCSGLTRISVPPKLEKIPKAITALDPEEIELGGRIKKIEAEMFRDMSRLSVVSLREGVTEIGSDIFGGRYYLPYIIIPRSVTKIAPDAFARRYMQTAAVWSGSYAEKFCKTHRIRIILRSEEGEDT